MHGPVVEGDAKKLLLILSVKPKTSDFYRWLVLDSPGGDVREALNLAKVVRDAMLRTQNYTAAAQVASSGREVYVCASSCVIVFMAGVERNFQTIKGGIGLHRPYLSGTYKGNTPGSSLAEMQQQAMNTVREFFVSERMPQRLIEEMMNRSSREIYWITKSDRLDIPSISAWFEEMLIAHCNYDPSMHERHSLAVEKKNQAAIEAISEEYRRIGGCSRTLVADAQTRIRSTPR